MTDDRNRAGTTSPEPPPEPPGTTPPEPPRAPTFEERAEQWGREAENAGKRFAANPAVADAADTATRVWGLLVLGVGLWFFAQVTLGYDMPSIPWRDVWPIGLIVIGLAVMVRGVARGRS
jgi:hypothetical protein